MECEVKMNQIILNIDNKTLETKIMEYSKIHGKGLEQIALEAINEFLHCNQTDKLKFTKKNINNSSNIITSEVYEDDDNEKVFEHIQNSAEYVHNSRQQKRY